MRRIRTTIALSVLAASLASASPALAVANGGRGWFGETNDKAITLVMFATIVFFPVVVSVFTFIQWRLDKRHHARDDAERARATSAEWRGGW